MARFGGVELDDLELRGARLTLRRWCCDDAPDVRAALTGPDVRQFLSLPDPYTADDARDFVTRLGNAERTAGTGLGCAVVDTTAGSLVGAAELRLPTAGRRWSEIGYWIAAESQRHGYAAEAIRLLAEWGFAHGIDRIEVRTDVRNIASARAALTAGFRFDGVSRGACDGYDLAAFGRLATDTGDPIAAAYPRLPPGGLTDATVALRCSVPEDAAGWIEQDGDELSVASGFTGRAAEADDIVRMTARAGLDWVLGTVFTMSVVDVSSGSFAGSVRVRLTGPPRVGELGYAVHPSFRGRGYTGRALRLFVPWAFEVADLARLELGAKRANVASQKAALSGGFSFDGMLAGRLRNPDGSFSNEVRFALTNPRYR
jgi:RimJ/RimL family protein N-acetyltransferase